MTRASRPVDSLLPLPQVHPLNAKLHIRSVLVLCEGNHCRAPIAEALLASALGPAIRVGSAGLKALVGAPAAPEAVDLLRSVNLDLSRHRGRQFTPAMAYEADLILVMDAGQKEWCTRLAPGATGRVFLLGHWVSTPPLEIADPFRLGAEAFRKAFDDIQQSVSAWVPHLLAGSRSA